MDRIGTFLVRSCYLLAIVAATLPFVAVVLDWNDPGHLSRFSTLIPTALIVAVLGKMLACLIMIAQANEKEV